MLVRLSLLLNPLWLFRSAGFGQMADLFTVPAMWLPALHYHHHLSFFISKGVEDCLEPLTVLAHFEYIIPVSGSLAASELCYLFHSALFT